MIIYGHNHFKIKEIHPSELGLIDDDYHIEIRQKYFHIYWIPFFGLGKIWTIRRNGELYDLPEVYVQEIKKNNIKIRSPWYTYSLPLILLVGFLIFTGVEKFKDHQHEKLDMQYFTRDVQALYEEIEHVKSNEFITLENTEKTDSESTMYLKVEKVYADKILFTLIPGFFLEGSKTDLEECYNANKANLDTITISKKDLKSAVNNDYEAYRNYKYKGQTILNSNNPYRLSKIEKKFEPKIDVGQTFIDYKTIKIMLTNSSVGFKIVSIKNITNSIPWNTKLPLEVKAGTHSNPSFFMLENTEDEKFSFYGNQKYSAELKIVDDNGIEYSYFLNGEGNTNTITKQQ
ncbi:hypothetical protein ACFFLS_23520 [Flavobacterium procerum]|uniref:Uncharacterized protein n=1 Tax=Flavobacterium procerum TaxID=1455569 RepID=A0ABV6BX75_9FLAO